jgi:hypothetical protein
LHTIAGELRTVVQEKVVSLWHTTEQHQLFTAPASTIEPVFERVVPLPVGDDAFRRAGDEPLVDDLVVPAKRERRSTSNARPRAL